MDEPRSAWEIEGGRLVTAAIDGVAVLCLKAHRHSRDYVNHYLVPLVPLPAGLRGMALVYVDPDTPLAASAGRLVLDESESAAAEVGDVVANASGRFLKLFDTARADRHFCYVDVATGAVRQRQERGATAVLRWRLETTPSMAD